jgi:uncharacterized protein (TIGR00299 family) protein
VSRTLHLEPVGGIAGDMLCAALIDLGAELAPIQEALAALPVDGLSVSTEAVTRGPFAALQFHVQAPSEHHPHRTWKTIRNMLNSAVLPDRARERALGVFGKLAQAEATVHGTDIDDVHFHEVGAWDSIADIVGACLALDALDIEVIVSTPPPVSTGQIHSAHGVMALPAPATMKLLEGWPIRTGPEGRECTTPTGAAFLSALATPGALPSMHVIATGVGAGTRNPDDLPNVLRATLGEQSATDSIEVLEAQMDDLTGEHLPPLIEALLTAGALDAYATQILMKKGRSGLLVTALAMESTAEDVAHTMLRHGSTFGVRRHTSTRFILDRWHETVETSWGTVRIKIGALGTEILHAAPEFEDVLHIAQSNGQPVPVVHAAALTAWHTQKE